MGTAVEDPQKLKQQQSSSRMERKLASSSSSSFSSSSATVSSAVDASAAAAAIGGRVARWRVGERVSPPSRQNLQLKALRSGEAHPLVSASARHPSASGSAQDPSREEKRPAVLLKKASSSLGQEGAAEGDDAKSLLLSDSSSGSTAQASQKQEMVLLQDGDLDPLGVLTAGLSDTASSSAGSLVSQGSASNTSSASAAAAARSPSAHLDRKLSSMSIHDVTAPREKKQAPQTVKELWKLHKDRVLTKFENVTFKIKANMLEAHDLEGEISWTSKAGFQREVDGATSAESIHVIKKTRERLEELERKPRRSNSGSSKRSGEDKTVEMTQSEYVEKIQIMEKELVAAWDQNQKVAALRIAIKCVKLLGDTTSSPQLYPCVFVLVSDVLDTFGKLVFERIKARASEDENGQPLPTPLSENFVSSDVNIQAKETCRNWFYKTACIRELLPRIYIEVALLRCYRFLCDGEYPQIVSRLSNMIKGIGEPMVALYTRAYLALCGSELLPPNDKTAVLSSIFDYFFTFNQFQLQKFEKWLQANKMTQQEYLGLHSPAVEWLMKCVATSECSHEAFETILAHYREYSDNSMVLKHICESFGPQYYASNPLVMLQLMRVSAPSQYSKCHLYSLLALQLSTSPTLTTSKEGKLQFLNETWTSITSQEDIAQYMECAAAFMKLIVAHFSHREALILLKDVVRHLNSATPEELTPKAYNLMGALIENVVYGAQDHYEFFTKLIPSGEFLTLMGMFKRESSVGVAKKVLLAFVSADMKMEKNNSGSMRLHVVGPEAAVAHTLFVICCRVHDALDSLSTPTERADATKDICAFISRLGYANPQGSDAAQEEEEEALLMLYIDCRSAFYKLEHVKTTLAKDVLTLAMHVHKRSVGGNGGASGLISDRKFKDRRNFIKSCLAYAHITIPSISDPFRKLELMTLSSKVALVNNCLPQMDAFLKAAIIQITELDPSKTYPSASGYDGISSSIDELELLGSSLQLDSQGFFSSTEAEGGLLRTIGDLVSVLVYAPSLNDDDAFYFINGLRKAVLERMAWDALSSSSIKRVQVAATSSRVRVLLFLLQLYGLWGQKKLPGRIVGLDSNDVLYGGDDAFENQVHVHFSETIEEIVRQVEAMDAINSSSSSTAGGEDRAASESLPSYYNQVATVKSGPTASVETLVVQVELMLDFINQVAPLLEQDDSKMSEVFGGAGSSRDLFESESGNNSGGSRRRKRSRCGAVLVRKCMTFAYEKMSALPTGLAAETFDSDSRKRMAWIREYYERTRQYLSEYFQTLRKHGGGLLLSETSKQAIQAVEDALMNAGATSSK